MSSGVRKYLRSGATPALLLSVGLMILAGFAPGPRAQSTGGGVDAAFDAEFRAESGQNQTDFVPGSSQIEENAILRRMERELGQPFTPRLRREAVQNRSTNQQARRQGIPGAPVAYSVELELGGAERRTGRILLGQRTLQLKEAGADGREIRHRVPLAEVASIEFLKWKAVRVHAADQSAKTAETGPGESGTNRPESGLKVLFFPSEAALTRRDGQRVLGQLEPFDWLQLHLLSEGNAHGRYRSYYGVAPENLSAGAEAAEGAAGARSLELPTVPEQAAEQAPAEIIRAIRFQLADGTLQNNANPDEADADAELEDSADAPDEAATEDADDADN